MDRQRTLILLGIVGLVTTVSCSQPSNSAPDHSGAGPGATSSISGVVRDSNKRPLEGYAVVIVKSTSNAPRPAMAPLTDSKGAFTLSGLGAGTFVLGASAPDGRKVESTVTVTEGQDASVTLTLPKP
jgi:hypothetical protein